MPYATQKLLGDPLFAPFNGQLSNKDQALLSYQRARAIGKCYGLTKADVLTCSPKFWALHTDPIGPLDGSAFTLLTIHYNLVLGTILQLVNSSCSREISTMVESLLAHDTVGQFLLTELQHGLDIARLETVATKVSGGGFILHTPHEGAAKYLRSPSCKTLTDAPPCRWMPPTVPCGVPCVGVVFAKLMVGTVFHGIRAFIVPLNNGSVMCKGVSARLAPYREGSAPLNHSLTFFDHVHLPPSALLGEETIDTSSYTLFERTMWRVAVGALALGSFCIPALHMSTATAALYSLRRVIGGPRDTTYPIFIFRTQHGPIAAAFAMTEVTRALAKWATGKFTDEHLDSRVRHGIAVIFKTATIRRTLALHLELSERLGAQGLFGYNRLSTLHSDMRGISIAEGDILVTSIRLATELLLGRYEMPSAISTSLLSSHEKGLMSENARRLKRIGSHRSPDFQNYVLPQCQRIVEAIGHRMAYDAAVMDNVPRYLLDLYEVYSIKEDLAWYVENGVTTREGFLQREHDCVEEALPRIQELLSGSDVLDYVRAPIISEDRWSAFVSTWDVYKSGDDQTAGNEAAVVRAEAKL